MLTLQHLFWITLFAAAGAWWWQARELKDIALQAARRHCQMVNVQLLDDSMVLMRTRVERADSGWRLVRRYQFEFTSTGDERYRGDVQLEGRRVTRLELQPHRI